MPEVTINNSPVHSDSILTAVYGETGSMWARFHTGTDFAPYGSTPANPDLYSVCDGTVYSTSYDGTLGNQILIKDQNGNYWRYCHMKEPSPLSAGDIVNINTKVGVMGATGNVSGIHLHLEYATSPVWNYDTFLNPSEELGIPNERGTIVHWDSTPPPPPPPPVTEEEKKKFPWAVLTRKIREKRS
jgi:murein DD-endopeptidase MepM/ murein hydrolase activator NlpD